MSSRSALRGILSALLLSACTAQIGEPPIALNPDAGPTGEDADVPQPDAGTQQLTLSNIPEELLDLGAEALVLSSADDMIEIDTDTGDIVRFEDGASLRPGGVTYTKLTQEDGPDLAVFSATSLTIEDGAKVFAHGSAALVFAVSGDAVIDGAIDASGGLFYAYNVPGPGGYAGGDIDTLEGQGPGGGGYGGDEDAGGGGGGYAGDGGKGGDRDQDSGGAGGDDYGSDSLVPLVGGSGGGFGGGGPPFDGNGLGGGGGGAVQVSARGTIRIGELGGINCGGGAGQGGGRDDGAGGGGAGGAILLEASSVEVLGVLAANGGGGGAGADVSTSGSPGQRGQFSDDRPVGGQGQGEGSSGGSGGAGDDPDGQPGTSTEGVDEVSDNAGGGGGGAGRITIRSGSTAQVDGATISPPASVP